jgi:hypothetical protein
MSDSNSETFMGIRMELWTEDRVFNLFLKHKITAKTSLEFVKSFLSQYSGNQTQFIVDKTLGLNLGHIFDANKPLFDTLLKHTHYKKETEIKYTPDILMKGFTEYMSQPTKILTFEQIIEKYDGRSVDLYYITLNGLVHMIDTFPAEYQTANMKDLFNKVVLWSAIMLETDNGANPYA